MTLAKLLDPSEPPRLLLDGLARLDSRIPVAALLGSGAWGDLPVGLTESAQFSAYVESLRFLERINRRVAEALKGVRRTLEDGSQGAMASRDAFVREMRALAEAEGMVDRSKAKPGSIRDIGSDARLRLIYDTQTESAHAYAARRTELTDPDLLDQEPAQELVRLGHRKVPRDWITRWREAGGRFYDGRMIALKTDPIWRKISRFGRPWSPYDYNSGMGERGVSRTEAEKLRDDESGEPLLAPDQPVPPPEPQDDPESPFAVGQTASLTGLSDAGIRQLKAWFGDQIVIEGDTARWVGRPPAQVPIVHRKRGNPRKRKETA